MRSLSPFRSQSRNDEEDEDEERDVERNTHYTTINRRERNTARHSVQNNFQNFSNHGQKGFYSVWKDDRKTQMLSQWPNGKRVLQTFLRDG
jgi:hypothetical protein